MKRRVFTDGTNSQDSGGRDDYAILNVAIQLYERNEYALGI